MSFIHANVLLLLLESCAGRTDPYWQDLIGVRTKLAGIVRANKERAATRAAYGDSAPAAPQSSHAQRSLQNAMDSIEDIRCLIRPFEQC